MLNTPQAVLVVLAVVVAVLGFIYFGYYLPRTAPAPSAPPPRTALEGTRQATNAEEPTQQTTLLTTEAPAVTSPTGTATATATGTP
jgi:hypothetical protein